MTPDEKINLYRQARALAWAYQLDTFTEAALKDTIIVIDDAIDLIASRFEASVGMYNATMLSKRLSEVELISVALELALSDQLSTSSGMVGSLSTREWSQNLSVGGIATGVNLIALSPEQFKAFFMTNPPAALPISGVVQNVWNDAVLSHVQGDIKKILQAGAVSGDDYNTIVNTLLLKTDQFKRNELVTITRTFFQNANAQAFDMVMEKNQDVIEGKIWTNANDDRVCLLCLPLGERLFKKGEAHPPMPRHPRCRCLFRAKTVSYRSLGIDVDELDAVAQPVVTRGYEKDGRWFIPAVGTGNNSPIRSVSFYKGGIREAFSSFTERQQQAMLGPARYVLYSTGKLGLDDLIDLPSGRLRLLNEIK